MLAPTICLLHMFNAAEWLPQTFFFPERHMSEDRNHFHGMANPTPHGMAMKGRDQAMNQCLSEIRSPRVGQVDNDWIYDW